MKTLKTVLFLILLASIAYKANAYYQYRMAAQAVPPHVKTVKARPGALRITLSGTGTLQALETKVVAVREVQSTVVRIIDDGTMVKAGQEVCQLDTAPIIKDLRDRQTAYVTAQAAVPKAEADAQLSLMTAATKAKTARQQQQILLTSNDATTQQAQATVKFNGSELGVAEKQKNRKESLAKDQLVPQHDVEIADLNVQSKHLNVTTATKQLEVQERTSEISKSQGEMLIEDAKFSEESAKNKARQQVDNARFNESQARRMLEMSQLQLQWCTVKAPIAGLVELRREYDPSMGSPRPLRAGDQIYPMRRLMDIIDTTRMIVEAEVGEIDIGHVRAGQAARVFPRAAPGTTLRARVKSVSEIAQSPQTWRTGQLPGKKVFRVVLSVLDSRPRLLRPGMSVDFELVEETLTGGVRVPIQVVFPDQAGKSEKSKSMTARAHVEPVSARTHHPLRRSSPASQLLGVKTGIVYVRKDGRFWPRAVTLGKRNDNDMLVTRGLKPGDVLAEHQPPASLIGPAVRKEHRGHAGGVMALLSWGQQS
jgi:multidrug efflux pump subunit AcrA (membrane-fusion protein)